MFDISSKPRQAKFSPKFRRTLSREAFCSALSSRVRRVSQTVFFFHFDLLIKERLTCGLNGKSGCLLRSSTVCPHQPYHSCTLRKPASFETKSHYRIIATGNVKMAGQLLPSTKLSTRPNWSWITAYLDGSAQCQVSMEVIHSRKVHPFRFAFATQLGARY